ncbi:MAG: DUF3368 domain-containing protein [Saprospiraceae bacterium]
MVVVSDTSPISGLYRIGQLHLLKRLYQRVIIPNAVFEELLQLRDFGYDLTEVLEADWIEIKSPSSAHSVADLQKVLDSGEAEAIALAQEIHADVLLIDEQKGRAVAKREGLRIIGLLGVLTEAKAEAHISLIKPLLDRLIAEANFRVSKSLYDLVLEQAGE